MNYLSLFSGVCGGDLAFQYLIESKFNCKGYVEINEYCQKIIKQRQEDGFLDKAPIFGDIKEFISKGYAKSYSGMVDLITAGFPCQPFSVAGKQEAENDKRNMWPATCETIKIIKPERVFLENVPGLFSSGYFQVILSDLAQIGYDARWYHLSAADCGAPHKRERLWILAYNQGKLCLFGKSKIKINSKSQISKFRNSYKQSVSSNSIGQRIQGSGKKEIQREQRIPWSKGIRRIEDLRNRSNIPEPLFCRMDDGMADYVDRIKAIGNGQVSIVAAIAWQILNGIIK